MTLSVVEVSRYGDHRFRYGLAKIGLSRLFKLLQDHGRDFRRCILFVADFDGHLIIRSFFDLVGNHLHLFTDLIVRASHETFDREDRIFWIGDGLTFRNLAYENFTFFREGDHGRGGSTTLFIQYDFWLVAFHYRDHGVGGSKVDSYNFSHEFLSPFLKFNYS